MVAVKYPVALLSAFLWIGFVCAISFMEAWLKFRAPGITLPLGLGIGRIVFAVLNKIEWVFAIAILVNILFDKMEIGLATIIFLAIPILILVVQTFWILPALDERAGIYLSGEVPPPSSLHIYFVGLELIKVASVLIFGLSIFKKIPGYQLIFNFQYNT